MKRGMVVISWMVLSAGCSGSSVAPPPSHPLGLSEPTIYQTGSSGITRLIARNIVPDSHIDLFSVARGDLSVRILPGAADGEFGTALTVSPGNDARQATSGDFNGDGIPDLAITGQLDNTLRIRLGLGNGEFGNPQSYSLRNHGQRVAAVKLNQDEFDDIVVAHDGSGQPVYINTYLGSADGQLQLLSSTATNFATSTGIASGDFDGDGKRDIAVAVGDERGSVLVFRGLGDGQLATPTVLPTTSGNPATSDGAQAIAVGDLNGDGRDDIVLACFDLTNQLVVWLSGPSSFTTPSRIPLPSPVDVALGDVNGDGILDAVAVNLEQGTIAVLIGKGDGSFEPPEFTAVGPAPSSLALADFDGNGKADIAVADIQDHKIRVLLSF